MLGRCVAGIVGGTWMCMGCLSRPFNKGWDSGKTRFDFWTFICVWENTKVLYETGYGILGKLLRSEMGLSRAALTAVIRVHVEYVPT